MLFPLFSGLPIQNQLGILGALGAGVRNDVETVSLGAAASLGASVGNAEGRIQGASTGLKIIAGGLAILGAVALIKKIRA